MESGQRDELELVAHSRQLFLEPRDGCLVELLFPVKGGRAVIGQQLARVGGIDCLGKPSRLVEIGFGSLAPDQVGIGGIGNRAGNRGLNAAANAEKSLHGASSREEWVVARIDIAGDEVR